MDKSTHLHLDTERYFATVSLEERDIALIEDEAAAERCRDDERAITIANGLLIAGLAAIYPLLPLVLDTLVQVEAGTAVWPLAAFLITWAFVTSVVSSYVCDLRRAYVFSARKVIVIRRLLGLSFGKFSLVLPAWRLEGADQPFAIRLFPGWRPLEAYSLYATIFLSTSVLWFALATALPPVSNYGLSRWEAATCVSGMWTIYWLYSMRRKLYDTHENSWLTTARAVSWGLRVRLVEDIHQTLYRAQLARIEAERLKLDFAVIKPILIYREDRKFFGHYGVAVMSTLRAAWDWLRRAPSGGASTITQQLARTLFVVDLNKTLRRKMLEIFLARWLESTLTKLEIIETYICSVRYESGVMGYLAARKHFRMNKNRKVTAAEAFVLIERISNVRRQFRALPIERSLRGAVADGLLTKAEAHKALDLYGRLIGSGIIATDPSGRSPEDIKSSLT